MTDPRPSENAEDIPQWPGFRAAGFFDDMPTGSIEELSDREVQDLGFAGADTQYLVAAIDRQTEQLRIRNLIQYAWTWPMARPELRDQIEKELGLA